MGQPVYKDVPAALNGFYLLSLCCRDEESSFMASQAPGSQHNTTSARIYTELKKNWWMWGSVAFTVLLISSLFIFRNSLYDTAAHGLPFLAGAHILHV